MKNLLPIFLFIILTLFSNCSDSKSGSSTLKQERSVSSISVADVNQSATDSNETTLVVTPPTRNDLVSVTLSVDKTSLNLDSNTTLTAVATYRDGSGKDVTNEVEWIVSDSNALLINGRHLQALEDGSISLQAKYDSKVSNTLDMNIVWIVKGHALPPKPDKTLNDSTLLGIDSNDNEVRDDVERWIYRTYTEPVEIGLFMQSARAYQRIIVDPSKAYETVKYSDAVLSCEFYWEYDAKDHNESYQLDEYRDLEQEISRIQFNSIKRHMALQRYNAEFNGDVLSAPEHSKEKCEFDENGILGD